MIVGFYEHSASAWEQKHKDNFKNNTCYTQNTFSVSSASTNKTHFTHTNTATAPRDNTATRCSSLGWKRWHRRHSVMWGAQDSGTDSPLCAFSWVILTCKARRADSVCLKLRRHFLQHLHTCYWHPTHSFTRRDEEKYNLAQHLQYNTPPVLHILLMNFQDTMDYGNFPSFYPKDDNFSHSDGIFDSVREEQQVSPVKRGLHASAAKEKRSGSTRFQHSVGRATLAAPQWCKTFVIYFLSLIFCR